MVYVVLFLAILNLIQTLVLRYRRRQSENERADHAEASRQQTAEIGTWRSRSEQEHARARDLARSLVDHAGTPIPVEVAARALDWSPRSRRFRWLVRGTGKRRHVPLAALLAELGIDWGGGGEK